MLHERRAKRLRAGAFCIVVHGHGARHARVRGRGQESGRVACLASVNVNVNVLRAGSLPSLASSIQPFDEIRVRVRLPFKPLSFLISLSLSDETPGIQDMGSRGSGRRRDRTSHIVGDE